MENNVQVKPEYFEKFKKALNKGVIEFKYKKKNGEIRDARGTTNIDIIGDNNTPKNVDGYNTPDNQIRYYDTNSNGWRSFLKENFIDWVN